MRETLRAATQRGVRSAYRHGIWKTAFAARTCGIASYLIRKVDGNHVGDTLTQFTSDYGVPEHLTFDGAAMQTGSQPRFMKALRRYESKYLVSGPRRPNENPAEQSIHEAKKRWYRIMLKKRCLCDLGITGFPGSARRRTSAQSCLYMLTVGHPLKSSRVKLLTFLSTWTLFLTTGFIPCECVSWRS